MNCLTGLRCTEDSTLNPSRQKAALKYRLKYSEIGKEAGTALIHALQSRPGAKTRGHFSQAVVIPAYDEGDDFLHRLLALPVYCPTLFVLVLNAPANATEQQKQTTLMPLTHLLKAYPSIAAGNACHYFDIGQYDSGQAILVLDLVSNSNPEWLTEGVGYARKTGTDCCLWLYHHALISSPWIRQTDADVAWPDDYLAPLPEYKNAEQTSALLYPFIHDVQQSETAALYDAWLRYYVAGLRWAGSPWAFHTVGSTIAVHADHYVTHRGFPIRDAGEDFYLLNKLAKSGNIKNLARSPLVLSSRSSTRTPFGTGRAIHNMNATQQQKGFYHPAIYHHLQYWQRLLPSLFTQPQLNLPDEHRPLQEALMMSGVPRLLQHCCKHGKNQATFARHLQNGFDAAMTRKCIHWMRKHYYPDWTLDAVLQAINEQSLPFIPPPSLSSDTLDNARGLSDHLYHLEATSHHQLKSRLSD